jgi:SlyX protein
MTEAELSARIEALEVRISYQDRTIEELNASVTAQWRQIDDLTKQVARMTDRLRQVEENVPDSGQPDPPPPHY